MHANLMEHDFLREKFVHDCKLPKAPDAVDQIIPNEYYLGKKFRKFCLISPNANHRKIYGKSTKVLEKERRYHLLNHYYLIHPFSDFSYYWGNFMLIINAMQLILAPITIINRVKMDAMTCVIIFTLVVGNINIIIQFVTGYYRYDIKEVVLEPKKIIKHYLTTFFIADFIGNFPIRTIIGLMQVDTSVRYIFKLLIAFNAVNFVRNLENLREKRDLDVIIVKLLACFAIAGIGLLWFSALSSLTAHDNKCNASMWWLVYLNFLLMTGNNTKYHKVFELCDLMVRIGVLSFGFVMRSVLIIQLLLFFKTFTINKLKRNRRFMEIGEFCHLKKLPPNLRKKIYELYRYKFQNFYCNEEEIWSLLSESMRQNLLDYSTKEWFEGDIFKLCPLALRQLITIHLDKEIFLKCDVIYTTAELLDKVYFIKSGTVYLYDEEDNLARIIQEGNFFSERSLLQYENPEKHAYKAVAVEICQLFILRSEVFHRIIINFPEEYNTILEILKKRAQYIVQTKNILTSLKLDDYYDNPSLEPNEKK